MSRHDPLTGEIPEKDKPISELRRLAGLRVAEARYHARILDKMEKTELARRKQDLLDDAKRAGVKLTKTDAEDMVRASTEWEDYIREGAEAGREADRAWADVAFYETKWEEIKEANANMRKEMAMSRG
jgi:hypothetical protein